MIKEIWIIAWKGCFGIHRTVKTTYEDCIDYMENKPNSIFYMTYEQDSVIGIDTTRENILFERKEMEKENHGIKK